MRYGYTILILLLVMLLAACSPVVPETSTPGEGQPSGVTPTDLTPTEPPKEPTPPDSTPMIPAVPTPFPDMGEGLPLFKAPQEHIAGLLNLPLDQVQLISFEQVEWADSCLGLAQPGEMCLQVMTSGYLLIFEVPQGKIEVHTDRSGMAFRLAPSNIETLLPPAVIWERSGGFAGICHRLTISYTGAFYLEDCGNNEEMGHGIFPAETLLELERYLQRYGVFEWTFKPPAGSADMFIDRYTFNGLGSQQPTAGEQTNLNDFFAKLAEQARFVTGPD